MLTATFTPTPLAAQHRTPTVHMTFDGVTFTVRVVADARELARSHPMVTLLPGDRRGLEVVQRQTHTTNPMDLEGIKLAFATSMTPQTLSGAALDGALVVRPEGALPARRVILINTSAASGAYSTDPITVTSGVGSESIRLTSENGGDSIVTSKRHGGALTIELPAMLSTGGQIQIGVEADRWTEVIGYGPGYASSYDFDTALRRALTSYANAVGPLWVNSLDVINPVKERAASAGLIPATGVLYP